AERRMQGPALLARCAQVGTAAGGFDAHLVLVQEPEAVPTAQMVQGVVPELEFLGASAQGGDGGGKLEIGHARHSSPVRTKRRAGVSVAQTSARPCYRRARYWLSVFARHGWRLASSASKSAIRSPRAMVAPTSSRPASRRCRREASISKPM